MKKILLFIILLILIIGIIFIGIGITGSNKNFEHDETSTRSVVGNKELVDRMEYLYKINLERDLRVEDLEGLEDLVEGDHYSEDEYKELKWAIEKKETLHISHAVTAISVYASTGQETFCIKDEMSHMRIYIQYGEEELIEHTLEEVKENLQDWEGNVKEAKAENPAYFANFEDIKKRVKEVTSKIESGDRSKQISSDLFYIEQYGIC